MERRKGHCSNDAVDVLPRTITAVTKTCPWVCVLGASTDMLIKAIDAKELMEKRAGRHRADLAPA
jgi:hypothetical protein